jgi:Major Facilitator Superfamily
MLYLAGQLSVPALGLVAIALSALEAFFLPALQAALPRLVEPAALTAMVSLLDSTDRLGRVLGPGMVGLLVLLPEVHLFTLDAASFLISAGCLSAALRHTTNTGAFRSVARSERLGGTALLAGWKSILAHAALRDALVLRGVCNLAWPAFTLTTPFLVAHRYQHGVGGYGLVLAVFGGGNLIGTVFAARVADRWLFRTCCLAWAGAGLGFLGLAGAPTYLLFLTGAAAIGVCTPLANVTVNAAVATTLPPHLLARAYTAQRITVVGASVLGLPLAAAITSGPGPTTALSSAGVLILGAAMLAIATTARLEHRSRAFRNSNDL